MKDHLVPLVVFTFDEQQYALHLSAVERIIRMVEVTPLPEAPEIVLGVINVAGRVVPAVNLRGRFGFPERGVRLSDQLILAHTLKRIFALWVDAVSGLVELPASRVVRPETVLPHTRYVEGIAKLADGITLIHDLETFLSLEEEETLDAALEARVRATP